MKSSLPIDSFLKSVAEDGQLLPTHISLFMAIFYYSNSESSYMAFQVCRRKLMHFSRIKSKATYHKCLAELVEFGYLTYKPSYDPFKGSTVCIVVRK